MVEERTHRAGLGGGGDGGSGVAGGGRGGAARNLLEIGKYDIEMLGK